MTKSQADRLARSYRIMAGRLFVHLADGTAADAGARDQIKVAHDALCSVFRAIEDKAGI